jgi:hypothetical protein
MCNDYRQIVLWKPCYHCDQGGHIVFEEPVGHYDGEESRIISADGCWQVRDGKLHNLHLVNRGRLAS